MLVAAPVRGFGRFGAVVAAIALCFAAHLPAALAETSGSASAPRPADAGAGAAAPAKAPAANEAGDAGAVVGGAGGTGAFLLGTPTPPSSASPGAEPAKVGGTTAAEPPAPAGKGAGTDGHAAASDAQDYDTPRYEPAGFPLLGGDSDIGFEFGAVGTLTRFGAGQRPYIWNMDLLLAASLKSNAGKTELTQQNYLWDIDIPGLYGGRVRVNPAVSYESTTNQAYFGLGNASSPNHPSVVQGEASRYFQYNEREARVRELTRIAWKPPWDIMVATTYRYDAPGIYGGSKLAQDAANGAIRGTGNLSLAVLGVGLIYDTRDNEYFPHRGSYHQIGFRAAQGFPTSANVEYGAFAAMLAKYVPLSNNLVFAFRGVVDAEFGHVPLLDLYTGGPFQTYEMIGGSAAVRGVPDGRYQGPLKVLGNMELRSLFGRFKLFGQRFRVGGDVLFDAGRLWSDYTFKAKTDGSGLGIKWGTGIGGYLVWGQAAVFRVEVAYSPDATAENPSLPLGIYVEDGVMF